MTSLAEKAELSIIYLMERYPQAIPVLRQAIEGGHIDGHTFGEHPNDTDRCLLGWVATVMGTHILYQHSLEVLEGYELYVLDVRPGETQETNEKLAHIYRLLCEHQRLFDAWCRQQELFWRSVSTVPLDCGDASRRPAFSRTIFHEEFEGYVTEETLVGT